MKRQPVPVQQDYFYAIFIDCTPQVINSCNHDESYSPTPIPDAKSQISSCSIFKSPPLRLSPLPPRQIDKDGVPQDEVATDPRMGLSYICNKK